MRSERTILTLGVAFYTVSSGSGGLASSCRAIFGLRYVVFGSLKKSKNIGNTRTPTNSLHDVKLVGTRHTACPLASRSEDRAWQVVKNPEQLTRPDY